MPRHIQRDEFGIRSIGEFDGDAAGTLVSALNSFSTTQEEVTLAISENITVSADLTVPSNVILKIPRGYIITVAIGVTLTINGSVEAGEYQIFSYGNSTSKVDFSGSKQGVASGYWWGAKGDNSNADYAGLQYAVNCGAPYVRVAPGTYLIDTTVIGLNTSDMVIEGYGATLAVDSATHNHAYLVELSGDITNVTFRGFTLEGNYADFGAGEIHPEAVAAGDQRWGLGIDNNNDAGASNILIEDVTFNGFNRGAIRLDSNYAKNITFSNCYGTTCGTWVYQVPNIIYPASQPDNITYINCSTRECSQGYLIGGGQNNTIIGGKINARTGDCIWISPFSLAHCPKVSVLGTHFESGGDGASPTRIVTIESVVTGGALIGTERHVRAQFTNCKFEVGSSGVMVNSRIYNPAEVTFVNCEWLGGYYALALQADAVAPSTKYNPVRVIGSKMIRNQYGLIMDYPVEMYSSTIASGQSANFSCVWFADENANGSKFVGNKFGLPGTDLYDSGFSLLGSVAASGIRFIDNTFSDSIETPYNISDSGMARHRMDVQGTYPNTPLNGQVWRSDSESIAAGTIVYKGMYQWNSEPDPGTWAGWTTARDGKLHFENTYGTMSSGSYTIDAVYNIGTWGVGQKLTSDTAFPPSMHPVTVTGQDIAAQQLGVDKPAAVSARSESFYEGRIARFGPIEPITTREDIEIDRNGKGIILSSFDGERWKLTVSNHGASIWTKL